MGTNDSAFQTSAGIYDLLYAGKEYVEEVNYVQGLLGRLGISKGSILELGSGTGKHGRMLAERGYRVLGVEKSEGMLSMSHNTMGFSAVQGDARSFQTEEKFDVVLSLFHVISYMTENEDIDAVFANTASHLVEGGLFVFDIWYSPAVYEQQPENRTREFENEDYRIVRHASPELLTTRNVVNVHYEYEVENKEKLDHESYSEIHSMRHYSIPEIGLLARHHGMTIDRVEEFMTANEPSSETWGVCFSLRKVEHD